MRIGLSTDLKTRTGAPDKDAKQVNSCIEVKGDQSVVRKRPCAQGGIAIGTGTAQGGIGLNINGVPYFIGFWADTMQAYSGGGTSWDAGTAYAIGAHVSYDFEDYWALADNTGSQPPSGNWSRNYVPAYVSPSSWTLGTVSLPSLSTMNNNIAWNGTIYCYMRVDDFTGNCEFITSTNGLSWTVQSPQSFGFLEGSIIYGNGTFLQLSGSFAGSCYTALSSNGVTWTQNVDAGLNDLNDVAWNGSVFCGVNSVVYTSPTGAAWTARTSALAGESYAITWNGSVFCAAQVNSTLAITSTDGITWISRTLPVSKAWSRMRSNGSVILALSTVSNDFVTSSDNGVNWTQGTLPIAKVTSCTSGNGLFLVVGSTGSTLNYCTSSDGINWTLREFPLSSAWKVAAYGAKFVTMDSTTTCATSTTGL